MNPIGFRKDATDPVAAAPATAAREVAPPVVDAPSPVIVVLQRVTARLDDGRSFSRVFQDDDDGALEYAKELARIGLTLLGKRNVLVYPVHRLTKIEITYEPYAQQQGDTDDDEAHDAHDGPCPECGQGELSDAISDTGVEDLTPPQEEFDVIRHGRTNPSRLATEGRRLRYRLA